MASLDLTIGPPSLDVIQEAIKECFGFYPCTWRLKAALTQLEWNDLLTLAPMGSEKTLTFWIPLLFNGDEIIIVVTPLIVLGEKNVNELLLVSIPAINLTKSLVLHETFKILPLHEILPTVDK